MSSAPSSHTVRLAAAWATLAPAPLVVAGLLGRERTWGIETAFGAILTFTVGVLPWLWAASADPCPADATARQRLRARAGELVLLIAVALPPLVLAAAFADVAFPAGARAVLYVLALLVLIAGALSTRTLEDKRPQLAALLGWVFVLPFGLVVWGDIVARAAEGPLSWIAPPLAVQRLLAGDPLAGPLLTLVALGVVGGVMHRDLFLGRLIDRALRRRPPLATAAAVALVLALVHVAGVAVAGPEARPLLGPHVRPGDPYPLRVAASDGDLAARSFGHHYIAPAGATELLAVPLGGGHHVELLRRTGPDQRWEPTESSLPEPRLLRTQDLLVAALGADAGPLATALTGERRCARTRLTPADLPLLARAGEAIDVVVAGRGSARGAAAPALRAWAAAGGVLVCATRSDLLAVVAPAGRPHLADLSSPAIASRAPDLELRRLGAGLVVGPRTDAASLIRPGLADDVESWLARRTGRRLQRLALRDAASLVPAPLPSVRSERQAAFAAMACALALVVLGLGLAPRLAQGTLLGGAALVAVGLAVLVQLVAAPSPAVYAVSTRILELPAGGRVAGRLQFVSVAAPRPLTAELTLRGYAPPTPVFDSGLQAVQSRAELISSASGRDPRLRVPLGLRPRTFQQLDALLLEGTIAVRFDPARRRVVLANSTPTALTGVWALTRSGIYPLPNLEAGGDIAIDLTRPPVPFAKWRMSADGADEAYRRRLITAAVTGRDLDRQLVIVGWGRPSRVVAQGVAEERALPPLVIVTATQGR